MKNIRHVLFIFLCLCILVMSGCTADFIKSIKTPKQDKLMAQIFNSFENEQYDLLYEVMHDDIVSNPNVIDIFSAVANYINGTVTDYKKTGYYYNVSVFNGVESITQDLTYEVSTSTDDYIVSMVLLKTGEAEWKVYQYNVAFASEMEGNGAVISFKKFDIFQLLMLVFSAACIGFMIYAIVACAKSPIRLKALWLILIILLHVGVRLTFSNSGFQFRLLFLSINISSLRKFINGSSIWTFCFPLGALLFVCLKKRLIASAARWKQSQQEESCADSHTDHESSSSTLPANNNDRSD